MALIDKNTAENLIVLISGILLFNGLVNIPQVGAYFKQYPLIIIGIAIVLLLIKDKIAGAVGG